MRTIFFILLALSGNAFGLNRQVHYEPEKIELTGHLDLQTFPGPPNYESIKSGDEVERHFYLVLSRPVDVILTEKDKASSINGDNFYNVTIFQLVVGDDKHWAILRQAGEGGQVTIKGTLFQRHTGHHHSRVLLVVENISQVKQH